MKIKRKRYKVHRIATSYHRLWFVGRQKTVLNTHNNNAIHFTLKQAAINSLIFTMIIIMIIYVDIKFMFYMLFEYRLC